MCMGIEPIKFTITNNELDKLLLTQSPQYLPTPLGIASEIIQSYEQNLCKLNNIHNTDNKYISQHWNQTRDPLPN